MLAASAAASKGPRINVQKRKLGKAYFLYKIVAINTHATFSNI